MVIRNNNVNKIVRYNGFPVEITDTLGGVITYDGDYKIHTFESSAYFISYVDRDVSALLVGGGSSSNGYGGGGGGDVKEQTVHIPMGTHYISVGKGGRIVYNNEPLLGEAGGTSSIGSIISSLGGYLRPNNANGATSGSGQPGGIGYGPWGSGGGGGGAGGPGANYPQIHYGGSGGAGKFSSIINGICGGGGGGCAVGADVDSSYGAGGHAYDNNKPPYNFAGQNGVVIIRYKYK